MEPKHILSSAWFILAVVNFYIERKKGNDIGIVFHAAIINSSIWAAS